MLPVVLHSCSFHHLLSTASFCKLYRLLSRILVLFSLMLCEIFSSFVNIFAVCLIILLFRVLCFCLLCFASLVLCSGWLFALDFLLWMTACRVGSVTQCWKVSFRSLPFTISRLSVVWLAAEAVCLLRDITTIWEKHKTSLCLLQHKQKVSYLMGKMPHDSVLLFQEV